MASLEKGAVTEFIHTLKWKQYRGHRAGPHSQRQAGTLHHRRVERGSPADTLHKILGAGIPRSHARTSTISLPIAAPTKAAGSSDTSLGRSKIALLTL